MPKETSAIEAPDIEIASASHQQQQHLEHASNTAASAASRKGVLKSIRNLFAKASLNLSIAASKLKQLAEEALSSDEIVDGLFLVTSSSSSIDSSLLEPEVQGQHPATAMTVTATVTAAGANAAATTQESDSKSEGRSIQQTASGTINTPTTTLTAFQDFDAVAEAARLRAELPPDMPFTGGMSIWEKRREAWLSSTPEERLRAKQRISENSLSGISKENYPIVYNSLVEKQKTLKKPMNLKDALRVINSGWVATKKWERASQGLA